MATEAIVFTPSASRGHRIDIDQLVHVSVPGAPDAFMLNLSECGMGIQAMDVLEPGRSVNFAFTLPARLSSIGSHNDMTDNQLQVGARIAWSDRSGRAGLQFTQLSQSDRFRLHQWVVYNGVKAEDQAARRPSPN
jgi:hypothetical protein